ALKSGHFPSVESLDANEFGRSVRDFRLLVKQTLAVAQRLERPLTAARLIFDVPDLAHQIGHRDATVVFALLRDAALQTLRACDIVAGVPEGIVICMPETAADAAQVVLDRIQRTVSAVIRPHLTMKVEIFSSADIERLLTEIR